MSKNAMMFIHCLTGMHPGSGTALGVVDMPVQRERHTQWPLVPGSSLKGVLRASCTKGTGGGRTDNYVLAAFGPETSAAADHAGALSISDARILAFPVRSLKGVFAWATCPAVLSRLRRDFRVLGGTGFPDIPAVAANQALLCTEDSPADPHPLLADSGKSGKKLLLEEFEFDKAEDGNAAEIAGWIARHAVSDKETADRLRSHLAILNDDDFSYFTQHATEVTARIGLEYESKTVREGALFYEEFLPPETLFYTLVIAENSRRKGVDMKAEQMLGWLRKTVPKTLQIGGGETVGKGICALQFASTDKEMEP